jgi:large subunit ribosomal protein L3
MAIGLVGRKCGMTRVFTDAGDSVPVTVVELLPNRVTQVKHGRARWLSRGAGHLRHAPPAAAVEGRGRALRQGQCRAGPRTHRVSAAGKDDADLQPGAELKVDRFSAGQLVDVTGVTIGKGYAGVMKRHNFAGGYASHGHSVSHRVPGSIGQRQTPGRVFPGKRMSGHMGVMRRTTENLKVIVVDAERNLLLISGAVPGSKGGQVVVRPSVKAARLARRKSIAPSKVAAAKQLPPPAPLPNPLRPSRRSRSNP